METPLKTPPCCPDIETDKVCNVLDFVYRLRHDPKVNGLNVPVEVSLHVRLEVCRGPMQLGNLAYSTTLLPGEKVRLFTMDRRSSFSFDTASSLSYRHVQSHEEQYYMASVSQFMSDLTVSDRGASNSRFASEFETSGSTSGIIESIFAGPSVSASGSYNSASTSSFLRELRRHAETSHHSAVRATRTSSSVSVGEVQQRTHAEGETESHFESASRVFSNPNKCHAVTFFFYQLNQQQTIKFTLKSIERRIIDEQADTMVAKRVTGPAQRLTVLPTAILATDPDRIKLEQQEVESLQARAKVLAPTAAFGSNVFRANNPGIDPETAKAALEAVDKDLIAGGLLEKASKTVSKDVEKFFSFELTTSLPTPGLLVKSCLDDCNSCEPSLLDEIKLDLERKQLENQLLKRQIELLDKAQEYRCCPDAAEKVED